MEIYLQKPGLGNGPHLMFQIREMLTDGRLIPEDLAWHEGQDEWLPIGKMETLQHLLPKSESSVDLLPLEAEGDAEAIEAFKKDLLALDETPRTAAPTEEEMQKRLQVMLEEHLKIRSRHGWAWRRFAARTLDGWWFTTAVWLFGWKMDRLGFQDFAMPSISLGMAVLAAWMVIEACMLSFLGTTPGKFCMGMRVVDENGNRPSLAVAFKRSLGVWFLGVGLGLAFAQIFCQFVSLRHFVAHGTTQWDEVAKTSLQVRRFNPLSILLMVGAFFAFNFARTQTFLAVPESELPEQLQEMQQFLKKIVMEPTAKEKGTKPTAPAPTAPAPASETAPENSPPKPSRREATPVA